MTTRKSPSRIEIPVTEEWDHPSLYFSHTRRPFQRKEGSGDFVTFSGLYSEECGAPVWFYSWGNGRWLRCPIGIPGDLLSEKDRIAAVDVALVRGKWMFVVSTEPAK
jgi:hypothetical protein